VDRAFTPGERFAWEGHEFTGDWMPGQTEFSGAVPAAGLALAADGALALVERAVAAHGARP
jgi:hypothetical protein